MFLPGRTVLASGSADFPTARDGMRSPLARKLFAIDGALSQRYAPDATQTLTLTRPLFCAQASPPCSSARTS
jgi:hypothetical protein